jgi:hypothetical protein
LALPPSAQHCFVSSSALTTAHCPQTLAWSKKPDALLAQAAQHQLL